MKMKEIDNFKTTKSEKGLVVGHDKNFKPSKHLLSAIDCFTEFVEDETKKTIFAVWINKERKGKELNNIKFVFSNIKNLRLK